MNHAILGCLVTFLMATLWVSLQLQENPTCTITLKDNQGAYHQMTGKADD